MPVAQEVSFVQDEIENIPMEEPELAPEPMPEFEPEPVPVAVPDPDPESDLEPEPEAEPVGKEKPYMVIDPDVLENSPFFQDQPDDEK